MYRSLTDCNELLSNFVVPLLGKTLQFFILVSDLDVDTNCGPVLHADNMLSMKISFAEDGEFNEIVKSHQVTWYQK